MPRFLSVYNKPKNSGTSLLLLSIEGSFHRTKDDFLKEDNCTLTDKNAIAVMAVINNVAYAIYKVVVALLGETMAAARIRFDDQPKNLLTMAQHDGAQNPIQAS